MAARSGLAWILSIYVLQRDCSFWGWIRTLVGTLRLSGFVGGVVDGAPTQSREPERLIRF